MKKKLLICMAAAIAFGAVAQSRMATEEWVKRYVRDHAAGTSGAQTRLDGGTNYVSYGGYTMSYEAATEDGLVVSEDTAASRAAGITNGLCFALADAEVGYYVRPGWIIGVTTNGPWLARGTWEGGTAATNGLAWASSAIGMYTWFVDGGGTAFARVSRTLLQPGVAAKLIGGGE